VLDLIVGLPLLVLNLGFMLCVTATVRPVSETESH
jgi:hypothetical protein